MEVDFLGSKRGLCFVYKGASAPNPNRRTFLATEHPVAHEEYFEYIDLLEAVTLARGLFTMMELAAGYGRWLVRGTAAA
jgi:hypothetical protein